MIITNNRRKWAMKMGNKFLKIIEEIGSGIIGPQEYQKSLININYIESINLEHKIITMISGDTFTDIKNIKELIKRIENE